MKPVRLPSNKGISLIEVLVGLAVFVLGILAVVRLFPGGFVTVKHSENVTIATRLAQAELERWKGRADNLPAGVLPWGLRADSTYGVLPAVDPENLRDPVDPGDYYYSDANKYRRVHAESTRIPAPISVTLADGSTEDRLIYILGFSPIAWDNSDPDRDPIEVYSGVLSRRYLPRDIGYLSLPSLNDYAIDYGDAKLYFRPANYARAYVITYSYWDSSSGEPALIPVLSEPFIVPAATGSPSYQEVNIPGLPPGTEIDEGSESIHRRFNWVSSPASPLDPIPWTPDDPYQYTLLDWVGGVIAFNPAGYNYQEITAYGKQPLIAHIDYSVLDWHIIREERKLPDIITSDADRDIKLSLRFIKEMGRTTEFDGDTYSGLAAIPPYGFLPFSLLAVDMETGARFSESDVAPGTSEPAFDVNYRDGIVRFHPNFAGRTFRIYYRSDGDWAVQVFKAMDVFRWNGGTGTMDHRHYRLSADQSTVFFSPCHGGSTVAVDYTYTLNDETRHVSGRSFRIDLGSNSINLLDGLPAGALITKVSKVYGVSLGSRVIWRQSGRGFVGGRWRQVQLQSYLTSPRE